MFLETKSNLTDVGRQTANIGSDLRRTQNSVHSSNKIVQAINAIGEKKERIHEFDAYFMEVVEFYLDSNSLLTFQLGMLVILVHYLGGKLCSFSCLH